MIITNLLLVKFVTDYPGAATAMLIGLASIIVTLVAGYYGLIQKRLVDLKTDIDELREVDSKVEGRVGRVERTLESYKERVGAGDKMFASLQTHLTDLSKQLGLVHEDNLKAHTAIVERLAKVEAKMPNGELSQILTHLEQLTGVQRKRK